MLWERSRRKTRTNKDRGEKDGENEKGTECAKQFNHKMEHLSIYWGRARGGATGSPNKSRQGFHTTATLATS
eukprot:2591551-Lingulodinium_polyedra.AAC.1